MLSFSSESLKLLTGNIVMNNIICKQFKIQFPIIQGGMVWCSDWRLASAVSNSGGLGLIGAGAMYPNILKENIKLVRIASKKPFGVNIPLIYPDIDELINIIIEDKVPIVFTSAGDPSKYTRIFQKEGIKVVHVVSNSKFALKAEAAGVNAIVAEGFEAGGHNGKEETSTFTLIPLLRKAVSIPLIAAGGISTGQGMLAAMILGADGIQMGTRFLASKESSAHKKFKQEIIIASEGSTYLAFKKLTPVRLLINKFAGSVLNAEQNGKSTEFLKELLGRGRAKEGMFEGNIDDGELEAGQVSALITNIPTVDAIFRNMLLEYKTAKGKIMQADL